MSIQAYLLDLPGSPSEHGIVLVDSVTDLPIRVPVFAFRDLDDADEFVSWVVTLRPRISTFDEKTWSGCAEEWTARVREERRRMKEDDEVAP